MPKLLPATASERTLQGTRMPYLPALDGLRALAVVAVLLYHADLPVSGGFLGVEIFFVLSGFLITALLLGEQLHSGRINLGAFWLRRARRLLPALLLVLAGTLAIAAALPPSETAGLWRELLAALGYVLNWHLVFSGQSYFDAGVRPSLLQHLWSLAVEEQFYLLWPPLFVFGIRLLRQRGLVLATVLLALGSALLAALLFQPGNDPSRIYYGTDTRASGLLLGAALALIWAPWRSPATARPGVGLALDIAGSLALLGLGVATFWLFAEHPLLYRGGLSGVALATVLVIAAISHPHARLLPALLGWKPLRWIGQRSYGIYLWHWPIFQITRPSVDVPFDGPLLLAARIGAAVLLAALSFHLVEEPVRRGALGRLLRSLRMPSGRSTRRQRRLALLTAAAVIFASSVGTSFRSAQQRPALAAPFRTPTAPVIPMIAQLGDLQGNVAPQMNLPLGVAVPATEAAAEIAAEQEDISSAVVAPAGTEPAQPATSDAELASALQAVIDRYVADGTIPGSVVAVSVLGQQPWLGASGLANRGSQTAMTPDTQVLIGSLSKLFTAVVVMQLVEEGHVSLDDSLATWLPDLVPNAEQIRLRHLLQHTTGLYDYLEDRRYVAQAYKDPERLFAPGELVEYAAKFPPAFAPGEANQWSYSSTNYVLLGMVIEAVTGNSLAGELRQRIFEPLGLQHTYFAPTEIGAGPLATGYARSTVQGKVAMSFGFATANLVSTTSDMHVFAQALFTGELLSDEARQQMFTFVDGKGQYDMPELAYGLGIMRNVLPAGTAEESLVYGHIGGFGGFRAAIWHAPASGVTIVLSVNQGSTDPNGLATELLATVNEARNAER